jgi:hypothetical protein
MITSALERHQIIRSISHFILRIDSLASLNVTKKSTIFIIHGLSLSDYSIESETIFENEGDLPTRLWIAKSILHIRGNTVENDNERWLRSVALKVWRRAHHFVQL